MKKLYDMTEKELFDLLKVYEAKSKTKHTKKKIEEILWAHRSAQVKRRMANGETVNEAGYTGRQTNRR